MAKFRFKFQGILELDFPNELVLKPGDKLKVSATIEGESDDPDEITFKDAEIQPIVTESLKIEPLAAGLGALPLSVQAVSDQVSSFWTSPHVTLESFGGLGYYKLIEEGLIFKGNEIESTTPIFNEEDLGKTFCGLFAHQNPQEPEDDTFFPGIIGSRYALITQVLDAYHIRVNFEFNGQSDKGYIFHDNSLAFRSAMNSMKYSLNRTLELQDGKTYVIPEYDKHELTRDFFLIAKNGANLKMGIEDYFQWAPEKTKKQAGTRGCTGTSQEINGEQELLLM